MANPPPNLCVFCGAKAAAREPCRRCQRPPMPGHWEEIVPSASQRARDLRVLVAIAVPWLLPLAWVTGSLSILLTAAGVPLPDVIAATIPKERSPEIWLGIVLFPLIMLTLAFVVGAFLRDMTLDFYADVVDTKWRFAPAPPSVRVRATTRGAQFRGADGDVTLCDGAPVPGARISSTELVAADVEALAGTLGEHPRDLLVMAAFAGMIDREEIEVRPSQRLRWCHGEGPMKATPGWDVRRRAGDPSDPVERALWDALKVPTPDQSSISEAPKTTAYRSAPAAPPNLASAPLFDVWNAVYAATKAGAEATGATRKSGTAEVRLATTERMRAWSAAAPAFHSALRDLGASHRSD